MRFIRVLLLVAMTLAEEEEEYVRFTQAEIDAMSTAEYDEKILGIKEEEEEEEIDLRPRDWLGRLIPNLTQAEEEEVETLRVPLERGMDAARKMIIAVCWWVYVKQQQFKTIHDYSRCRTDADVIVRDVVMHNRLWYVIGEYVQSKDPEEWKFIEKSMGRNCMNRVLGPPCYKTQPKEVQRNCTEYLSYPREKYEVDESAALGLDKDADYPYLGFAHCLMHTFRLTYGDKAVDTVSKDIRLFRLRSPWFSRVHWKEDVLKVHLKPFMIKMVSKPSELLIRAHIMVCWYEYLIASHEPQKYKDCKINEKKMQTDLIYRSIGSRLSETPENFDEDFGNLNRDHGIQMLPKIYQDQCAKYLIEHPLDDPPADESAALGVDSEARFHFRSYDYCLLHTLRNTHGDDAILTIRDKMPEINKPVDPRGFKISLAKVARAQYLVCWYEIARHVGTIGHQSYEQCKGKRSFYNFKEWNTKIYHQNQEMWEIMFGYELMQHNMQMLPSYRKACKKYLSFYTEHFPPTESDILDDEKVEYSLKSYAHCIIHHMREIHGEKAIQLVKKQLSRKVNPDDYLETLMGIEMVTTVNTAIGYHDLPKSDADFLSHKSERARREFIESDAGKDFSEYKEVKFASEIRDEIFKFVPKAYHDCKTYLTVPEEVFPENESGKLGDEGVEYQFKSYCHCMLHTLRKTKGDAAIEKVVSYVGDLNPNFRSVLSTSFSKIKAQIGDGGVTSEDLDAAVLTIERGFKLVCWYEFAKSLPGANQESYNTCNDASSKLKSYIMESKYVQTFPEMKTIFLGRFIKNILLQTLPTWYAEKCTSLLDEPYSKSLSDEAGVLTGEGSDYAYKAYANCIIHSLRDKHGDQAIEDVKMKATQSVPDWRKIIYERLNKARNFNISRSTLNLSEELSEGAQKHAEELASKCVLEKSNPEARKSKDGPLGESVAWNSFEPEDAVLFAVSEILEEGKLYERYTLYTSPEDEWTEGGIGRYVQMVWSKTTQVGFGLAVNRTCETDPIMNPGTYIVIRYFKLGTKQFRYY